MMIENSAQSIVNICFNIKMLVKMQFLLLNSNMFSASKTIMYQIKKCYNYQYTVHMYKG